jgi:hypothetical protein
MISHDDGNQNTLNDNENHPLFCALLHGLEEQIDVVRLDGITAHRGHLRLGIAI